MQIQELVDEYRKKTDEELLRLARDREQPIPEALSALTDEMARRKIAAERLRAFSKDEERQGRIGQGNQLEVQSMLTRMIDLLKSNGITAFFTSLVSSTAQNDTSGEIGVSSLIDTWIVVRELEENEGKRRVRGLYIVKSRGMGHSSDVHKLILSDDGISLVPMEADATAGPKQKERVGKSITVRQTLIKR